MSRKAVLAALASALLANTVWADESGGDWVNVAETSSTLWEGKKGSGHVTMLDGKKNAGYAYVYQIKNKQKNTYEYGQVVIDLDSCRKGYGFIYYNDMQGKYTGKDTFVRFNSTVADNLGSTACLSWDSDTGKVSRQNNGDAWEAVTESDQSRYRYSLKTDTVRKRTYNGKPAISALYSDFDKTANQTTYNDYVIATSDCARGFGTIYQLDFDGKSTGKYDVALNGSSVIAVIANTLCSKI